MSKTIIQINKPTECLKTSKEITLSGSHCHIFIEQNLRMEEYVLKTFWRRLTWLFTGKIV